VLQRRREMQKTIDVLLVEDSDADSKIASAAVRRVAPSASLVRVKDGEQALRLILHKGLFTSAPHVPRLIVLELNVPRTDGHGVLRRLRDEGTARIPIIVVTSSADRQAIDASYALGAQECVFKAGDSNEYFSGVARAVQRHLL
jgi:two-component system response regulator